MTLDTADPSFDEFSETVDAFLSRWPKRSTIEAPFEWGVGSDDVSIFDEVNPQLEHEALEEARAWRWDLAAVGLSWITGPRQYGGRGLPQSFQSTFDALARRRQVPDSSRLTVSLGMVAPTILVHGSEVAKQRYLPALHDGRLVACQMFSEPDAGSDLAAVQTRARRDGTGWRITGQKVWTSGAHLADIAEVLCRTSDQQRHRNLTVFVIDMRAPGVDVRPLRQMTGGASFNQVFLEDVRVPDHDRLGDIDGGWKVAMTTLSNERSAIGGSGFGGRGLLRIDRLKALLEHTGRIADPTARQELASILCGLRTAAWTRRRFAASANPGAEAALLKLSLCRDLTAIGALVSRCLGPAVAADSGEWGTYAWSDFLVGLPGYRIGGGTDEVLKTTIGERVLGLPKEPPPL